MMRGIRLAHGGGERGASLLAMGVEAQKRYLSRE